MKCKCPTPAACIHNGDLNRDVPKVIVREARRLTLAVVNFLKDVQGIELSRIKCEFVENYEKRLVLHSVYDIHFKNSTVYDLLLSK